MDLVFLRDFARRIAATGRITATDVAALAAHEADFDGRSDGLATADALLAIDAAAADRAREWTSFLTDALVDLLVWGERPTGVVSAATADWLLSRMKMEGGRAASATHRALLVALVREAQDCDPRLAAAAFGYDMAIPGRAPAARAIGWLDAAGAQA